MPIIMRTSWFTLLFLALVLPVFSQGVTSDTNVYLEGENWDVTSDWTFMHSDGGAGSLTSYSGLNEDGLVLTYTYPSGGGWVNAEGNLGTGYNTDQPIVFFIYSSTELNYLELKFTDTDGSVFGVKTELSSFYGEWKQVTVYLFNTEYWWGGNGTFDTPLKFSIALSGSTAETASVYFDEIGIGKAGLPSTFPSTIDPNATLPGTGFLQRRDEAINTEDPLVLEYLKAIQDYSSTAQCMIPSVKGGTEIQTFNNSLTALAFIVKDERERAERILDFYQEATDSANTDIRKQNFFYNYEARGFYQQFVVTTGRDGGSSDRWIGDMAWLLIAAKYYENTYSSDRYDYLIQLIRDLFLSYYKKAAVGGYIQSGWRDGDSYLHEATGHHEGNIDCYVALKLCGDHNYAHQIKVWLDNELDGKTSLPVDLYTWRTLAFGALDPAYVSLLNIPEYDFRFRKVITVNEEEVMGMFSNPDIDINNFWNDATGHISCAFQAFGDAQRGYFYANQMDHLLIEESFGTDVCHTIPYTLNKEGGYSWVDTTTGFVSCAAWYIMAKNGCNPFMSEDFTDIYTGETELTVEKVILLSLYPNPFRSGFNVVLELEEEAEVELSLLDMSGRVIDILLVGRLEKGPHTIFCDKWPGSSLAAGTYLLRARVGSETRTEQLFHLPQNP